MRVVVAEDFVLLREGLAHILERCGYRVVASVGDVPALVDAVRADPPDLVVTDVRMPPDNTDGGLRAAIALRRERPGLPVVVLSQYIESTYATELLHTDAAGVGYLLKDRVSDVAEFADAVERVAAGGTVIDPTVVSHLLARNRAGLPPAADDNRRVLAVLAYLRNPP